MTVTRRAFIRHLSAAAIVGTAALTLPPPSHFTTISELGAFDPPAFDHLFSGAEATLTINYRPSPVRLFTGKTIRLTVTEDADDFWKEQAGLYTVIDETFTPDGQITLKTSRQA